VLAPKKGRSVQSGILCRVHATVSPCLGYSPGALGADVEPGVLALHFSCLSRRGWRILCGFSKGAAFLFSMIPLQPRKLPFTPQFSPFTAYYLTYPYWHAILSRVCQAPARLVQLFARVLCLSFLSFSSLPKSLRTLLPSVPHSTCSFSIASARLLHTFKHHIRRTLLQSTISAHFAKYPG
jgi:hypothetical protein